MPKSELKAMAAPVLGAKGQKNKASIEAERQVAACTTMGFESLQIVSRIKIAIPVVVDLLSRKDCACEAPDDTKAVRGYISRTSFPFIQCSSCVAYPFMIIKK